MSDLTVVLEIVNRTIPVILTLFLLGLGVILYIGAPLCQYVSLVSDADTDKGKEKLAKYLAKQTGGRNIDTEESWKHFVPAARDLHKRHVIKKDQR